jgi:maltose-binding protein MalE
MDEDGLLTLRNVIFAFQRQKSEIQINLVYIPYDDLFDRYVSAVDLGEGPDLILGSGEWGPILYDLNVIADVSNFVSSGLRSEINPPALEMASHHNLLISLPVMISGGVMYRNKAIISEAPSGFEVLVKDAQDATTGNILGAYLERGSLYAFPHLTACGGSLMYANGYPAFDNQAGICWLNLLKSFNDAGPVSSDSDDDLHRFKAGRVGIIIDGTWNLEMLSDSLGENLAVDPWPRYNNEHLSGYVWSENVYVNPDLSDDERKAARIFTQFLLSQETQTILSQGGYIPAIMDLETSDPITSQAINALSLGTPYPFQPELKLFIEPLHAAFDEFFYGGVDAVDALGSASDEIFKAAKVFKDIEGDL